MCLDLIYRNSKSEFLVDFSYLAIQDKMIVNKVYEDEDETSPNTMNGINYGGIYENYLWLKLEDTNGDTILTTLINYDDLPYNEETFGGSLQGQLTALWNEELWRDLYSNVLDMFLDSIYTAGFAGTYIGELIDVSLSAPGKFYCQVVDFGMHLPSEDYIHPEFDT